MRILKIELQNINSLKSDMPIVIDFESEVFKDTGLFAITGSTGSGKTTILDAITIALYQNVPRFQKKGSLFDAVSYGAKEAFSRITFENNQKVYEAFWGVRMATSTGKKLKNPREEVSLKNLTDGKILATQKRKMIDAVEEVTQLNYEQFLRSVMLAQGEFAAFLSAKPSEKGKLLEQITGEEIYKRIGEQVLWRRGREEEKLNDLKKSINEDDILSGEEKVFLQKREQEIKAQIKELDKQLEAVKKIEKWYKDYRKLIEKQEQLQKDEEAYKKYVAQHQKELELLTVNEESEPFKPLIDNILRNENTLQEKTKQVQKLNVTLKNLEPEIKELTQQETALMRQVVQAKAIFEDWLPKFDELNRLETDLKNRQSEWKKIQQNLSKNKIQITDLQQKNNSFKNKQKDLKQKFDKLKVYVEKHAYLEAVNEHLTNWTTQLTNLKNQILQLNQARQAVSQRQQEIDNSRKIVSKKEVALEKLKAGLKTSQEKLLEIDSQLKAPDIKQLMTRKDRQQAIVEKWKKMLELAADYVKLTSKITQVQEKIADNAKQINEKEARLKNLLKEIETQSQAVADAQQIYDLQKSIKNYEEERKRLVAGKPCPLCGSTEHPFAGYDTPVVTEAETELKQRQKDLEELLDAKNRLNTDIRVLQSDLKIFKSQLIELQSEQQQVLSKAESLQLNTGISQPEHIKIQYEQAVVTLKDVDNQLNKAQNLQAEKNRISEAIQKQKDRLHQLEQFINTQKETQKLYQDEIGDKQSLIDKLKYKNQEIEQALTPQLNHFGYSLPEMETTETFIGSIKDTIREYSSKKETLSGLLTEIDKNKIEIDNLTKQIEQQKQEQQKLSEQQDAVQQQIKHLRDKRIAILPVEVSIAQKRKELTEQRNALEEKQKATKKQLEEKIALKRKNETLLETLQNEIAKLNQELTGQHQSLTAQLTGSRFGDMQAVRNALLSPETKREYLKIKKKIDEAKIQIATLKTETQNTINQHLTQKTFEISEAENQEKLQVLEARLETLLSERGEIKEKYRKDAEIRSRNQEITKQIDAQKKVFDLWQELYKIIGGSKDAFNVYVQRLTLKQLLDLANMHLYRLNKRYSLQLPETYKPKEELNFFLIDHYQTGQRRLVETASGGEKFLISLALALGLSDLASKNVRIDSLFIDEGFGTLDSDTLETVISTLETLQSQGKMIGIISHVEALKERIPRQIRVVKKSNGVSKVEIV